MGPGGVRSRSWGKVVATYSAVIPDGEQREPIRDPCTTALRVRGEMDPGSPLRSGRDDT